MVGVLNMEYNNRQLRSYNGEMMQIGQTGETVILEWLKSKKHIKKVIDLRDLEKFQRLDIDCYVETYDGSKAFIEIKTDQHLASSNNFLFEVFRINHFAPPDKIFYKGWAFRSQANYLIYYSLLDEIIYEFSFDTVRKVIGTYVAKEKPKINITLTDDRKTTFNFLIPKKVFEGKYKQYKLF